MGLEGLILLMMLLWLSLSVGTAIHASGQNKTMMWGVGVAVFGIFGLIFYGISLASD